MTLFPFQPTAKEVHKWYKYKKRSGRDREGEKWGEKFTFLRDFRGRLHGGGVTRGRGGSPSFGHLLGLLGRGPSNQADDLVDGDAIRRRTLRAVAARFLRGPWPFTWNEK